MQLESFYLNDCFRQKLDQLKAKGTQVLRPLLDLTKGLDTAREPLVHTAVQMGFRRKAALRAFDTALKRQTDCLAEMKHMGETALKELETDPDKTAVVIFGRPYNGFVEEAHMGIPHKLASRGILVIPFDFLLFDNERCWPRCAING